MTGIRCGEACGVNRVALSGRVQSRETLRYTPAGIAVIEWRIAHLSQQDEAGQPRRVECEIDCITVGKLALQLEHVPLGAKLLAHGFLAARSRRRQTPTLHVTEIEFLID